MEHPILDDWASQSGAGGHLLRNMVLFARLLRVGDLDVTPTQMTDWLQALRLIDLSRKDDFKEVSRAMLVRRRSHLDWFDAAFELFWQARDPNQLNELEMGLMLQRETRKQKRTSVQGLASEDDDAADSGRRRRSAIWSDREALGRKDFADLTVEESEQIKRMMARMSWQLETRLSRRHIADPRGALVDLRRTLRKSLDSGGELIDLAFRKQRRRRRPLVVLCDVSGSMEAYSRLLLHFIYAISHCRRAEQGLAKVESFVFGTRLTRISQYLKTRDIDRALTEATRQIEDWGGGTRTGESLKEFNYVWSRRVLGRGAVVMIISDGWDRGDIDLLGREMERLQRSCHRLIWLNPLLGSPTYEPLTRGMRAALPHVDDFLPVHNLRSLEQLGDLLASLRGGRVGQAQRAAA